MVLKVNFRIICILVQNLALENCVEIFQYFELKRLSQVWYPRKTIYERIPRGVGKTSVGPIWKVIQFLVMKITPKRWQMYKRFNYMPITSNRIGIWSFKCRESKIHYLASRLMYLLANLGQVFVFKFRVKFWHFFTFSLRLYTVLRRRQPTFSLFYRYQIVVSILLPQPTTVDSTDFSSHVRLFFITNMVSLHLRNYYCLTEDTLFQWSIYRMHLCEM